MARPLYTKTAEQMISLLTTRPGVCEGNMLPPEDALAEMLDVGRSTVREALRSLEEKGIITKRQGVGNLVHSSVLRVRSVVDARVSFMDIIAATGRSPSASPLMPAGEENAPDVASMLGLEAGVPLPVFTRLHYGDGIPAIFCKNYVPAWMAQQALPQALQGSIFEFLRLAAGCELSHTLARIGAASTEEGVRALNLTEGTPLVIWEETHFSVDDRPLAVTKALMNPDLVSLIFLRKAY
ncbi:MAG: GntR family transcriptional regulator [Firmicutes bacterium]|nr:GntR family transcriptional regulator [Bacillota bacterium]